MAWYLDVVPTGDTPSPTPTSISHCHIEFLLPFTIDYSTFGIGSALCASHDYGNLWPVAKASGVGGVEIPPNAT